MEEDKDIFRFDADDIKNFISRDIKLYKKMGKSFDYIHDTLTKLKFSKKIKPTDTVNLEKLKWDKGKNYNWFAFSCGPVKLIFRVYGGHFTIFGRNEILHQFKEISYTEKKYSAFTFYVNTDKVPDNKRDYYYEHSFEDLNLIFHDMVKLIAEDHVHSFWNNYCFIRPDYCEVENIYDGDQPANIDRLIYCAEELSTKHMSLFAENNMLEIIKTLTDKVGQPFGNRHKIESITTEFPKQYSDPYYHGVGIAVIDEDGKKKFHDVYRLTQWYMEDIKKLKDENC